MRKAIVVAPAIVVVVSAVGRDDLFKKLFQILDEPGFIFDGCQGGCGTGDEKRNETPSDLLVAHFLLYLGRDVNDIAESLGLLNELSGMNFH